MDTIILQQMKLTNSKKQSMTFFHLIYCFRKNEKITNFANVWMLEVPLQKKNTVPGHTFQIYFYEN